jgi:hypothetical protein
MPRNGLARSAARSQHSNPECAQVASKRFLDRSYESSPIRIKAEQTARPVDYRIDGAQALRRRIKSIQQFQRGQFVWKRQVPSYEIPFSKKIEGLNQITRANVEPAVTIRKMQRYQSRVLH